MLGSWLVEQFKGWKSLYCSPRGFSVSYFKLWDDIEGVGFVLSLFLKSKIIHVKNYMLQ
jgi:hypothetical protein